MKSDISSDQKEKLCPKLQQQYTTSLPNFENQIKGVHFPSNTFQKIKTISDYKYKVLGQRHILVFLFFCFVNVLKFNYFS